MQLKGGTTPLISRLARPTRSGTLIAALLGAAVLAGCTLPRPAGEGTLRYVDPVTTQVNVTNDLTYGSAPDNAGNPVDLKLDLYQPAGDAVTQRPALIWVHGGGFFTGDKADVAGRAVYFAQRGYVVAAINYRLLAPAPCHGLAHYDECRAAALEAQHDGQAAVRWLRKNASTYRIDTNRIAMGGGSAGAITALLTGWRSEDPGDSGNPGFSSRIAAAVSVSGGVPIEDARALGAIDAQDPPTIFFSGTADTTVPYEWQVADAIEMYNLGIFTVLEPFEGAGHQIGDPSIPPQSAYFLYYAMNLKNAAS
jgi:acetyl esterase/lipase